MVLFKEMSRKVRDALLGQGDDIMSVTLTRQELLDSLFAHFKKRLAEETTDEGMLFATSFYVYLNEDDYQAREQSFPYTVREAVNKFNKVIRSMLRDYPSYKPHAQFWQFQFIPFAQGNLVEGMKQSVAELAPKEVFILSSIHPVLRVGETPVAGDDERVVATVHSKDSMAQASLAINRSALSGVDIQAKDRFNVDFNAFKQIDGEVLNEVQANNPKNVARARLKIAESYFLVDGERHSSIYMTTDYLQISGRGGRDTSGGMMVARIDSDEVMNRQLILHYDTNAKRILMTTLGDVKLNDVTVAPGSEVEVAEHSDILINGAIQLTILDIRN